MSVSSIIISVLLICTYMIDVKAQYDVDYPMFYAIGKMKTKITYGEYSYIFAKMKNCTLWRATEKLFLHKEKSSGHWLVTEFYNEPNINMNTCEVTRKENKTDKEDDNRGRRRFRFDFDTVHLKHQQNSTVPQHVGWEDRNGNSRNVDIFPCSSHYCLCWDNCNGWKSNNNS